MDQVSSVREAKLIVAPIAMAALAVDDVERESERTGITELNVSIVIDPKEPHIHGQTSLLAAVCRGSFGQTESFEPCIMRTAMVLEIEVPIGSSKCIS